MSEVIKLDNVAELLGRIQGSPNGTKIPAEPVCGINRAFLKFKLCSVCEVFGYQMAEAMGVRVPKMQGFWTDEAFRTDGDDVEPGRIGIVIEYHEDWNTLGDTLEKNRELAAEIDHLQVARALTLCLFDRYEWGEFAVSDDQLYFFDLERLLPDIEPETLLGLSEAERVEWLREAEAEYDKTDNVAISMVCEEAKRIGLTEPIEQELHWLCSLDFDIYSQFLGISGHPLDTLLSRFAAYAFGKRLNSIAEWLDLPTHEVQAWQ